MDAVDGAGTPRLQVARGTGGRWQRDASEWPSSCASRCMRPIAGSAWCGVTRWMGNGRLPGGSGRSRSLEFRLFEWLVLVRYWLRASASSTLYEESGVASVNGERPGSSRLSNSLSRRVSARSGRSPRREQSISQGKGSRKLGCGTGGAGEKRHYRDTSADPCGGGRSGGVPGFVKPQVALGGRAPGPGGGRWSSAPWRRMSWKRR